MTNTFFNYNNLEDFRKEINKLREDLDELTTNEVPAHEILEYDILLLKARPVTQKGFWAYDEPGNMPSDARVAYAYTPTYLATSILMYSWMNYPEVRERLPLEELLRDALRACTGRNFRGHGYAAEEGFIDAMQIFEKAHAEEFVNKYPDFCPDFTSLYRSALEYYRSQEGSK